MENARRPRFIVADKIYKIKQIVAIEKMHDGSLKLHMNHCGADKISVEFGADKVWEYFKNIALSVKSAVHLDNVDFVKIGNKIIQIRNVAVFTFKDPNTFEIITKITDGLCETLPIEIDLIEPEYRDKIKEFIKESSLNSEYFQD